jgi:hypothetical protein
MYVSRHFAKRAEVRAVAAVTPAMDDLEEPLWERRTRLLAWANASVSRDQIDPPEPRPLRDPYGGRCGRLLPCQASVTVSRLTPHDRHARPNQS